MSSALDMAARYIDRPTVVIQENAAEGSGAALLIRVPFRDPRHDPARKGRPLKDAAASRLAPLPARPSYLRARSGESDRGEGARRPCRSVIVGSKPESAEGILELKQVGLVLWPSGSSLAGDDPLERKNGYVDVGNAIGARVRHLLLE